MAAKLFIFAALACVICVVASEPEKIATDAIKPGVMAAKLTVPAIPAQQADTAAFPIPPSPIKESSIPSTDTTGARVARTAGFPGNVCVPPNRGCGGHRGGGHRNGGGNHGGRRPNWG